MAIRFRRTIKIAPGLKINVGKRGVSVSAGVRGATATYGRGGLYGNVGVPGTGLSYRSKIGGSSASRGVSTQQNAYHENVNVGMKLSLQDDGKVDILDDSGNALPPKYLKQFKEQKKEFIQSWLEEKCEHWNNGIESILNLHLETPPENFEVIYTASPFKVSPPEKPEIVKPSFFGKFFKGPQQKAEAENVKRRDLHKRDLENWNRKKEEHQKSELVREEFFTKKRYDAPEGMQDFLSEVLADIEWPRETLVAFEVSNSGKKVYLDIDFPEIEDMPTEQATVAARGIKINVKARSETQRRKDYMQHIHAILFRIIGEAFVALPTVETVIASGFSQRPDKQTGKTNDEYLLSAKVQRLQWKEINFSNLSALSLPECFEQFEIIRKMTKTGVFKAIEPIGMDN